MMNAELRCSCGQVRGHVADPSPRTVNRVVCYCADCQAFAHRLGRADLLNAQGGSDIVQVAPAALTFVQGQDRITGLRLKTQAKAICAGVAPCFLAMPSSSDPGCARSPAARGYQGMKPMPCFSQ